MLRAKKINSKNSRLYGNVYTGEEYHNITLLNLQSRLAEYPELAKREANTACYFEDATRGYVDNEGNFIAEAI